MEIKNEEEVKGEDVNEEADLDKELDESLSSLRAESGEATQPEESKETKETPSEETKDEQTSQAQEKAEDTPNELLEGFKTPKKGKFESEESYNKRLELADLVKQRKLTRSEEEKKRLSEEISGARRELSTLNASDKINKPNINGDLIEKKSDLSPEEQEAIEQDRQRLKSLGGLTKEDLQEMLQKERLETEVKSTLETFVSRHPELKDDDTREVFFDFVDSNYNWSNKSGKDLLTVLELARENMFKPSETIQDRVLKAAGVAEKVNAMQFPGGTIVKPSLSSDQKKSIDELVSTGMSESKALELISE